MKQASLGFGVVIHVFQMGRNPQSLGLLLVSLQKETYRGYSSEKTPKQVFPRAKANPYFVEVVATCFSALPPRKSKRRNR